jgi:beta-hydroxylase
MDHSDAEHAEKRIPFFDAEAFEWTKPFLDGFSSLRAEIENQRSLMTPMYPAVTQTLAGEKPKTHSWFTRTLVFFTIRNPGVLKEMPETARLLAQVPGLVSSTLVRLEPGTHLKPHCGYSPDVLRCHLGVVVPEPEACVLRVDREQRTWDEGKWLIFDDYLEHEVWHRGTKSRTILLLDVVRPGVDREPREIARRFFEGAPGTRFDEELEELAKRETWLEWLTAGEFGVAKVQPAMTARRARRRG